VPGLDPLLIGPADVAVGTIFFTVPVAMKVAGAVPFHLCQGYEGLYEPAREHWPLIEETYALPTEKLVVSPHLVELLASRFGQRAHWIPQPLDTVAFAPGAAPRPADGTFRVLLTGQWDVPVKGIAWALEALRPLREELPGLTVVRLSQDAPRAEVEAWPDAERHVAVPPANVPGLFRSVDLFLGPSSEVEGFGLPTLEAMACAIPCVVTDIGAVRGIDPESRASLRVPFGDPEALRRAVRRLAADPDLRARLGRNGREIAGTFTPERTGAALVGAFRAALARR
jgi:glycosyltransferase involved in cell wall biosynthesis